MEKIRERKTMSDLRIRFIPMTLLILLGLQVSCLATLNMRGLTSYFRASPGGNFVVNQPITGFNGKLIRDSGGIISGNPITFSRGLFEDSGNDLLLTAILDLPLSGSEIQLTGAAGGTNLLRAQPGTVFQTFLISGNGNRIEGSPLMTQNIVLTDVNTSVTIAMQTPLNSNITLNNGTVSLEADLVFADFMKFNGTGTINASNHKIIFGGKPLTFTSQYIFQNTAEVQLWSNLTLSGVSTFTGTNVLNGNGNIITFNPGGAIEIGTGGVLYLTDVVLKNFGNTSFIFDDPTGQIIMSNVTVDLDEDVTTTIGNLYVEGPATVVIKGFTWRFSGASLLTVDGVTLWSDFAGSTFPGYVTADGGNLSLLNTGTIKSMDGTIIYCDVLHSEVDYLNSRINELQSCCDTNTSCCADLQTRVDALELCAQCQCVITITQDTYFDLSMLPAANNAVIFRFTHCIDGCPVKNHLIFDPTVYGNGGVILMPPNTRMVFDGEGLVELQNGVIFSMQGTYMDPLQTDWPAIITQNLATMYLDPSSTVMVNGVGCFNVRSHGTLQVANPQSQIVFGTSVNDEIAFNADFDSNITINDPTASIAFYQGTYDIIFNNHSALHILQGVLDINMLNGDALGGVLGYLRTWHMINGAELDIAKYATGSALLRVAANLFDLPVDFDDRSGFIREGGDFEYKLFDDTGATVLVDTVCQIQSKNITISTDAMSDLYRELCYVLNRQIVKSPDATILCLMGTRPNPAQDGRLAAFLPNETFYNASIVGLQQGDHDVCYNRAGSDVYNVVCGADRSGAWFTIYNGSQRVTTGAGR